MPISVILSKRLSVKDFRLSNQFGNKSTTGTVSKFLVYSRKGLICGLMQICEISEIAIYQIKDNLVPRITLKCISEVSEVNIGCAATLAKLANIF